MILEVYKNSKIKKNSYENAGIIFKKNIWIFINRKTKEVYFVIYFKQKGGDK